MSNGLADWLVIDQDDVSNTEKHFWLDDESPIFQSQSLDPASQLQTLTFTVGRNPKDLLGHLRRVYFCRRNNLAEPLYAALLDLLIVLHGRGKRLSGRLIQYCHAVLSDDRYMALIRSASIVKDLPTSRHSLLANGTIGKSDLLERIDDIEQEHAQLDYLALANDFIEYSQLEEAMNILETGLKVQPRREDLQVMLLELYRSTRNRDRFRRQYQLLLALGVELSQGWHALELFFDGRPS